MSDIGCTSTPVPGTDLVVSSLCFGTMTFGDGADEQECQVMYALARDAGLCFFDCANVYADGESERILGRLIAGHRADVVITTKAFYPVGPGPEDRGLSPGHLSRELDASLERLGTDYVDIFYFHAFDPDTPISDSLEFARDAMEAGKIRHLGVSNFAAWQVMKARWIGHLIDAPAVACIQPMYNALKRQCETELLPMSASEGLGVFSYGPLGGGLLTGKYERAASGARRLDQSDMYRRRYDGDHARASAFAALARSRGLHPASLAVAWAATHPAVTAPIIGARTVEQLRTLLASTAVELGPDLLRAIDDVSPPAPIATDRQEEAPDHVAPAGALRSARRS